MESLTDYVTDPRLKPFIEKMERDEPLTAEDVEAWRRLKAELPIVAWCDEWESKLWAKED